MDPSRSQMFGITLCVCPLVDPCMGIWAEPFVSLVIQSIVLRVAQ